MDDSVPVEKRTFDLQPEEARYLDGLVASGAFASTTEVVRAGLRALQDQNAVVEKWLRDDVVPVYDQMKADPGLGRPLADVRGRLRARHLDRLRAGER